jgi:hypothetical protein
MQHISQRQTTKTIEHITNDSNTRARRAITQLRAYHRSHKNMVKDHISVITITARHDENPERHNSESHSRPNTHHVGGLQFAIIRRRGVTVVQHRRIGAARADARVGALAATAVAVNLVLELRF